MAAQLRHQLAFQGMARDIITGKEMIMIFIGITSRTVGTITRIVMVNNLANRKYVVRPFDPEEGTSEVLIAKGRIVLPVNIAGE